MHQGNPNVEKEKTGIDKFVLCIEKKNEFGIYADSASVIKNVEREKREYKVNVRRLCFILCRVAENYYEGNKSKFDFFDYNIEDSDLRKAFLREKAKEIEQEEKEMNELSNLFRRK